MEPTEQHNEFESVKARLEEIANAVDDESISLDDALDLYEEAVKLGLQASDLLEVGIVVGEEALEGAAESDSIADGAPAPNDPAGTIPSASVEQGDAPAVEEAPASTDAPAQV